MNYLYITILSILFISCSRYGEIGTAKIRLNYQSLESGIADKVLFAGVSENGEYFSKVVANNTSFEESLSLGQWTFFGMHFNSIDKSVNCAFKNKKLAFPTENVEVLYDVNNCSNEFYKLASQAIPFIKFCTKEKATDSSCSELDTLALSFKIIGGEVNTTNNLNTNPSFADLSNCFLLSEGQIQFKNIFSIGENFSRPLHLGIKTFSDANCQSEVNTYTFNSILYQGGLDSIEYIENGLVISRVKTTSSTTTEDGPEKEPEPEPEPEVDLCQNGSLDTGETEIDCGGPCSTAGISGRCHLTESCVIDSDCQSNNCSMDFICTQPTLKLNGFDNFIYFHNYGSRSGIFSLNTSDYNFNFPLPFISNLSSIDPIPTDYPNVGPGISSDMDEMTFAIWIKPDSSNKDIMIYSQSDQTQISNSGQLALGTSSGKLLLTYMSVSPYNLVVEMVENGQVDLFDGNWHLVGFSFIKDSLVESTYHFKVFIDGITEIESTISDFNLDSRIPSIIGASANGLYSDYLNDHINAVGLIVGEIGTISIWNVQISEKGIVALYNGGNSFYYLLDSGDYNNSNDLGLYMDPAKIDEENQIQNLVTIPMNNTNYAYLNGGFPILEGLIENISTDAIESNKQNNTEVEITSDTTKITADSNYSQGDFAVQLMFDNNTGTYFHSNVHNTDYTPNWIELDFETMRVFSKIEIFSRTNLDERNNRYQIIFYDDAGNETFNESSLGGTSNNNVLTIDLRNYNSGNYVSAKKFKLLRVYDSDVPYYDRCINISEMKIYGLPLKFENPPEISPVLNSNFTSSTVNIFVENVLPGMEIQFFKNDNCHGDKIGSKITIDAVNPTITLDEQFENGKHFVSAKIKTLHGYGSECYSTSEFDVISEITASPGNFKLSREGSYGTSALPDLEVSDEYLDYELQLCSDSDCATVLKTIPKTTAILSFTPKNNLTDGSYSFYARYALTSNEIFGPVVGPVNYTKFTPVQIATSNWSFDFTSEYSGNETSKMIDNQNPTYFSTGSSVATDETNSLNQHYVEITLPKVIWLTKLQIRMRNGSYNTEYKDLNIILTDDSNNEVSYSDEYGSLFNPLGVDVYGQNSTLTFDLLTSDKKFFGLRKPIEVKKIKITRDRTNSSSILDDVRIQISELTLFGTEP